MNQQVLKNNELNNGIINDASQNLTRGKSRISTRLLVQISLLSAVAFVVMYIEFPLGALFPGFLQIDFSDVVAFVGGVALGPVAAIAIEFIKNLLHLFIKGGTAGIGEVANFIVGVALVVPAAVIYRKKRRLKNLIIGFVVGIISMVLVASVTNYFVFLPLYESVLEFDITYLFPTKLDSIIYAFAPFNMLKGIIVAIPSGIIAISMKSVLVRLSSNK